MILNNVYVVKLAWHILTSPYELWVKVMKAKHGCGTCTIPV